MIKEELIRIAKASGFNASVGKTDKDGKYHPYVNALGKDVPVEWIERVAELIVQEMCEVMKAESEGFDLVGNFGAVQGIDVCMRKVKTHFGVE